MFYHRTNSKSDNSDKKNVDVDDLIFAGQGNEKNDWTSDR